MNQQKNKYYTIVLLIIVFAAPGITAWLFYNHPTWLGASRVNKGELLPNPIELTSITGKDKWRILYWAPENCEQTCLNQLDLLARVRLALGRKFYQVDQKLLLADERLDKMTTIAPKLKVIDFQINPLSSADKQQLTQLSTKAKVFLMNPTNYLILSYNAEINPDDIYKDLKLLLNNEKG